MFEFKIEEKGDILEAKLQGRLDATQAPALMDALKKYIGSPIKKIVFESSELAYIASAGIRTIIFAKQKIGQDATVVMQNPCEDVVSVIEMTGLSNFIEIIHS